MNSSSRMSSVVVRNAGRCLFVLFVANCTVATNVANATVLKFDDVSAPTKLADAGYAELTWELGNLGLDAQLGGWVAGRASFAHSGAQAAINAQGSTLVGITFPALTSISGAYFGPQGNIAPTTGVRVHGYLNGIETGATPWLMFDASPPTWLDMTSFSSVDRIVVESIPTFQNAGAFGMDDLTFTVLPEPGTLGLIGVAAMSFLSTRPRKIA